MAFDLSVSKLILIYWQSAIEGSLNVLRQAEKAGVRKFVVTSSIVTAMNDPAVKGTAYRSHRRLFLLRSDLVLVTYFTLQIGIQCPRRMLCTATRTGLPMKLRRNMQNSPCGSGQELIQTWMSPQVSQSS